MSDPGDLSHRRSQLSPAQRALLEKRLRGQASKPDSPHISPRPSDQPAPLSFSQQRLWFLNQLEPESPIHQIAPAFRISGRLDITGLARSFTEITRRHEILRTTFDARDGEPQQTIQAVRPFELPVIDLSHMAVADREAEAQRLTGEFTRQPFNLKSGPLLRARLIRLASDEHVLHIVGHHIAVDGWSIGILATELADFYDADVGSQRHLPPELPCQIADFAYWQRNTGTEFQSHADYWKRHLHRLPTLNLPADRSRPAEQSYRGRHQVMVIPPDLYQALTDLAQVQQATPFMALLTVFLDLLRRITGQNDLVVGAPVAGRTLPELEPLIGHFTNNLVLRADLSDVPSFTEGLQRVRQLTLDAYARQDFPFEQLVELLQPDRDLSRNPLFQVMFNLRNVADLGLSLSGLTVTEFSFDLGVSPLDLSVDLEERPNGLWCAFIYNTDLFDDETIGRMMDYYQRLLVAVIQSPDEPITTLSFLSDDERRQLLVEWNRTSTDYLREATLPELFEQQVERNPDAVALISHDERISFVDLNRRANQLAYHLRSLGVGPESIVGLYLERSIEAVVAMLGVMKAGAAYLPLDPSDPADRQRLVLDEANCSIIISHSTLADGLIALLGPLSANRVVWLDTEQTALAEQAEKNPPSRANADSPAYVIYTSGSGGRPKGVVGLHRGVVNRCSWMWGTYPFVAEDVCCHKTTLSFVDSVWEIFGPLLQGVSSVIVPSGVVQDPRQLVEVLAEHDVTRLVLVPSLLRAMLDSHPNLGDDLPALLLWTSSGEALPAELYHRFRAAVPQGTLLNLYGSSEVAADVTCFDTRQWDGDSPTIPIGGPISNTQIYLLDDALQPVPVGVAAELYVSGDGLSAGYLNQPELTAEKFIPHPFADYGLMYKTGDLARYRADGMLEFVGRADEQVKIRGFRVELDEVTAALLAHPGISEAVVVAFGPPEDRRLAAYLLTPADGKPSLTPAELNGFLRQKVPAYMLPAAYGWLAEWPRTPSGKIDLTALPDPQRGRARGPSHVPPQDSLTFELVRIWERVLEVSPVSITANFFDLGGHSLLAVRLLAEIEDLVGQALPLAVLFQAPTVAELAARLREEQWMPPWRALVPIQPEGDRPPLFCVHALGGNVIGYAPLARYLGPEQPFYGLQAMGLDGDTLPLTRVEDMAAHYLAEARTVQPDGPYYLSGFSFGGVVAYEMARQLLSEGQEVALLALIDTPQLSWVFHSQVGLWQRLWQHLRNLWPKGWSARRAYLQELRIRSARVQPRTPAEVAARHQRLLDGLYQDYPKLGLPIPTGSRHLWNINQLAHNHYVPRVYPGRIVLFENEEKVSQHTRYHLGWTRLAGGGLEVHGIPGDHLAAIKEPVVRLLAEKLSRSLQQARETEGQVP